MTINSGAWKTLDFTGFEGRLSYVRGGMKVHPRNPQQQDNIVPLEGIRGIIASHKVDFSSGLFMKLAEYDIPVIIVDWRGFPLSTAMGWSKHSRICARHNAQANLSLPQRKTAWANIVKSKIRGQANVLQKLGHNTESAILTEMAKTVRSGDANNVEGYAARIYWGKYFNDSHICRNQDGADFLNSCLNYGYTVLRISAIKAISEAGLSPTLGLFHHSRGNAHSLADDLMEPFRPAIDYAVATCPAKETLDSETKRILVEACNSQFLRTGESIPTSMSATAQQLGQYVEGDIKKFSPAFWSGHFAKKDE